VLGRKEVVGLVRSSSSEPTIRNANPTLLSFPLPPPLPPSPVTSITSTSLCLLVSCATSVYSAAFLGCGAFFLLFMLASGFVLQAGTEGYEGGRKKEGKEAEIGGVGKQAPARREVTNNITERHQPPS